MNNFTYFPNQKLPSSKKTKEWAKQNIDFAENFILGKRASKFKPRVEKIINYDLLNGKIVDSDIYNLFDPFGLGLGSAPTNIQNYNLVRSKVDLLVGEEWKRKFDWKLIATNYDSISNKETIKKEKLMQIAMEAIQSQSVDEKEIEKRIKELDKYANYEYQDIRELTGTRILQYLWRDQDIKLKFNKGMYDVLTVGEELYRTDIVGGNPIIEKVNPVNVECLMMGESSNVEDAEMIIEYGYKGIGKIIEEFYDVLSPTEISNLENNENIRMMGVTGGGFFGNQWRNTPYAAPVHNTMYNGEGIMVEAVSDFNGVFGNYYNNQGEVRILRVRWLSKLKRYILSYIDPNTGDKMETLVSEHFKLDEDLKARGFSTKEIWVDEWWEGTKIGSDLYIKLQPRIVQFRDMANPAIARSGYVGSYYNINNTQTLSLVDRMKPFQYLYNIIMRRIELAIASWKPPITEINLALKPNAWDLKDYMHYLGMGFSFIDPFNTVNEGVAKGQLAGSMNTFSGAKINPSDSMGNYIAQNINLLTYIEMMMGKVSGITDQRQGQVSNNETVGGVERSVTQSSHITEYYFALHDNVKKRALSDLLETAKIAYGDLGNEKVHYILDDVTYRSLELDVDNFVDSSYGIFVSDSAEDTELRQMLKQLAHAGIQNDKVNFTQLIDIFSSDSMSAIRKKIERAETDKEKANQEQFQAQLDNAKELENMRSQQIAEERDFKASETAKQRVHELLLKQVDIKLQALKTYNEGDDINVMKLELEKAQQKLDAAFKEEELKETIRSNKAQEDLKEKEISVKKVAANKKTVGSKN